MENAHPLERSRRSFCECLFRHILHLLVCCGFIDCSTSALIPICRLPLTLHTLGTAFLHVRIVPPDLVALAAHLLHRQQPNPTTQSIATDQWIHLIQAYARHRRLFLLRVEDAETTGNDWDEVLRNERINSTSDIHPQRSPVSDNHRPGLGRLLPVHLAQILAEMVAKNIASYDPPKQTRSVLLYWRLPEEWAEALHSWVRLLYAWFF